MQSKWRLEARWLAAARRYTTHAGLAATEQARSQAGQLQAEGLAVCKAAVLGRALSYHLPRRLPGVCRAHDVTSQHGKCGALTGCHCRVEGLAMCEASDTIAQTPT